MVPDVVFALDRLDRFGLVYYLSYLADGLTKEGYDVSMLARAGNQSPLYIRQTDIPIRTLASSSANLFAPLLASRFLKELSPTLIQTCDWPSHVWTRLGASTACKSAMLALYVDSPPQNRFFRYILHRLHLRDTWICTPFRFLADRLRQLGLPHTKIQLVPVAVRKQFVPAKELEVLRTNWRLPVDSKLIVAFASFSPKSQVKVLIWAMDILRHAAPNVYSVILGDAQRQGRWEQFIRDLHLEDHLRLVANTVDFAGWLVLADLIWVCPDTPDCWFYVVSGLSLGKPVIAFQSPMLSELVIHRENGILIPAQNPVALAYHSRECLEFPDLSNYLSRNAEDYAATRFHEAELVRTFRELYRNFLSQA